MLKINRLEFVNTNNVNFVTLKEFVAAGRHIRTRADRSTDRRIVANLSEHNPVHVSDPTWSSDRLKLYGAGLTQRQRGSLSPLFRQAAGNAMQSPISGSESNKERALFP